MLSDSFHSYQSFWNELIMKLILLIQLLQLFAIVNGAIGAKGPKGKGPKGKGPKGKGPKGKGL